MAADPRYILSSPNDRERLILNFEVMRAEFLKSVARALDLAKVDARNPAEASFRLLDAACGEGLHAIDLARRFPRAEVVAFDRDSAAIEMAKASRSRARFLTFDLHQPLPGDVPRPFDVVQVRLGLTHFTDGRKALANLFEAMRPGAALYLLDVRSDTLQWPHPSMAAIQDAATTVWAHFGTRAAGERHTELLKSSGFVDVDSSAVEYPADLNSRLGRGMLTVMVETANSFRRAVVEVGKLMAAEAFDEHVRKLRSEISPGDRGACRMQLTFARRP